MNQKILRADFDDPRLEEFLAEHLADMMATSPPESVHALDLDGLRRPSVRLWVLHDGGELAAAGALSSVGEGHEELKSMRTRARFRGRGLARRMLQHLVADAASRGVARLSLETGVEDYFAAARAFYAMEGFELCDPFGVYAPDPNSVFMTRELAVGSFAAADPAAAPAG
ncbi:GNAT family N-acetyltransferase [Zhihengliuella salsuginis]|uniref:N-acetyltransferase n=1 Tax=Zhihengliuella salsuginis TaxID=578222 RepID=A0ABQ3GB79_9MICC|nr:GNAT family N-acetyltransferase [Zhihengliuella salsuginis]GHD00317.1 N-acetyltransferase [Zhihengliuella salsuginis]